MNLEIVPSSQSGSAILVPRTMAEAPIALRPAHDVQSGDYLSPIFETGGLLHASLDGSAQSPPGEAGEVVVSTAADAGKFWVVVDEPAGPHHLVRGGGSAGSPVLVRFARPPGSARVAQDPSSGDLWTGDLFARAVFRVTPSGARADVFTEVRPGTGEFPEPLGPVWQVIPDHETGRVWILLGDYARAERLLVADPADRGGVGPVRSSDFVDLTMGGAETMVIAGFQPRPSNEPGRLVGLSIDEADGSARIRTFSTDTDDRWAIVEGPGYGPWSVSGGAEDLSLAVDPHDGGICVASPSDTFSVVVKRFDADLLPSPEYSIGGTVAVRALAAAGGDCWVGVGVGSTESKVAVVRAGLGPIVSDPLGGSVAAVAPLAVPPSQGAPGEAWATVDSALVHLRLIAPTGPLEIGDRTEIAPDLSLTQ